VGRPVVATDVGGVADLVQDGVTGRLCPPGDPGALARALLDLLSDQPQQHRMGLAARAIAQEKFHHARITARHASLYHTLASGVRACPDIGGCG
jgi:glycosyltransferase involved in cell wall biosynthesis